MIKVGFLYDVVSSSLLGMYAECNMFEQATRMFAEMPEEKLPAGTLLFRVIIKMES